MYVWGLPDTLPAARCRCPWWHVRARPREPALGGCGGAVHGAAAGRALLWGRRRYSGRGLPLTSTARTGVPGSSRGILSQDSGGGIYELHTVPPCGAVVPGWPLLCTGIKGSGAALTLGHPLPLWATVTPGEPQVPDLKAVLTAVLPPVPPNRAVVQLTYTIVQSGHSASAVRDVVYQPR